MTTLGLRIAAAILFVCGAVSPIAAQEKKPPKPAPPPPKPHATGKPAGGNANRPPNQPSPVKELDQFSKMSPKEREKELSKLPPQRRAAFEQRFALYQRMTPEQQEKFKQTLETMESLPKDRQNAVKQQIQMLQALPFAQRKKLVESEAFRQKFSPDEQRLILGRFPKLEKPNEDHED